MNNAGTTGTGGLTADYDIDDWHRTIALNLDSVFFCLRTEIPVMLSQGGGAIVNVASGAGLVGFAGLPAYVASKHGVVGLTRASALEYAAQGIRINCVCPGSTRTPMLEGFMGGDEKIEKMMRNAVPMRRLGRPEEIAAGDRLALLGRRQLRRRPRPRRRRRLRHPVASPVLGTLEHAQAGRACREASARSGDAVPEGALVAHRVVEDLGRDVEALASRGGRGRRPASRGRRCGRTRSTPRASRRRCAWRSGPSPVSIARPGLSSASHMNGSSSAWQLLSLPSITGVAHVNRYMYVGRPCAACASASRIAGMRNTRSVEIAVRRSPAAPSGRFSR